MTTRPSHPESATLHSGPPNSFLSLFANGRSTAIVNIAGSLWLVAMTVWYVITAAVTFLRLADKVSGRNELRWVIAAAVLAGLFAVAVIAHFKYRRLRILSIGTIAVAFLGLVVIVIRGEVLAAVVVAWIVIIAWSWGDWFLRHGGFRRTDIAERASISLAIGLAFVALVSFGLGLCKLLSVPVIVVSLVILTVAQVRTLRLLARSSSFAIRLFRREWNTGVGSAEREVLIFVVGLILLHNLMWAVTPETRYDALNYQLAVPRIYLENGAIVDLPYFWHSYFSRLMNAAFLPAMALGGQIGAKLIIFATGLIAATGVYALGRRLLSRRAGRWAAAIFLSTPLVSVLTTTAYVDVSMAMFVVTAWLAFLRWRVNGRVALLCASGALAGAAIAVKMNGVYAILVIALVLGAGVLRRRQRLVGLRDAAAFALSAAIVALPWYLLTWWYTGNPFFPLLNGVFRSPYWQPVNERMNAAMFGTGQTLGSLLTLPLSLTFNTRLFDEVAPAGALGIALVLLPLSFLKGVTQAKRALLLVATLCYFVLWAFTFQYARYYIPFLPIIAALSVTGVIGWAGNQRLRQLNLAMLWMMLLTQSILVPTAFGNIVSANPVPLLLGRITEEQYIRRALPPYGAVEYVNSRSLPGDKVIGFGVEHLRYYIKAPVISLSESRELGQMIRGAGAEQLSTEFDKNKYRFLIINRGTPGMNPKPIFMSSEFLNRFALLAYSDSSTDVYHLSPTSWLGNPASTN